MGEFFTALGGLATSHPFVFLAVVVVLGFLGAPYIRKIARENAAVDDAQAAIRQAGDEIRKELGAMLDKEQARVESLANALDAARVEVGRMRGENADLRADMGRLRSEVRTLFRTVKAMRMAMQRAVDSADVLPLRIWLDLNPAGDEETSS